MMTDLELGKALRRLRQQAGIKQENVAYYSGYHQTEISRMERGQRVITIRALRGYAKAMDRQKVEQLLKLICATLTHHYTAQLVEEDQPGQKVSVALKGGEQIEETSF